MKRGYRKIKYDTKNLMILEQDGTLYLLELIPEPLRGQPPVSLEQSEEQTVQIERQLMVRYHKKVDRLTLLLHRGRLDRDEIETVSQYSHVWCADPSSGELYLFENQISDFAGIRKELERYLEAVHRQEAEADRREIRKMFTPVNLCIVLINVAVFLILMTGGDVEDAGYMAAHGAMVREAVESGEYYRMITAMFLHFGADHLLQNMLILLLLGCRLERLTGHMGYLFIYLGSGLAASTASLLVTLADEPMAVSAGASGAIFGVLGGLLFYVLAGAITGQRQQMREVGITGIIFMIMAALSYGFFEAGVDNAAHVGGLAGGFLLTGFYVTVRKIFQIFR